MISGLRCRCPRCGEGRVFRGFYTVLERCQRCQLEYDPRGESLAFVYLSTVALSGLFLIVMFCFSPSTVAAGQRVVMPIAAAVYLLTMPPRKGLALSWLWLLNRNEGGSA